MDRLTEMEAFATVVDQGGFTDAAKKMGISKSAVSKHVSALEARLRARLLNRTTRRVSPTEIGLAYYDRARRVLNDAGEADALVTSMQSAPSGLLRISVATDFGVNLLSPILGDFLLEYPDITVNMVLNNRYVELISEGFDMAIRVGDLEDSSLRARKLTDTTKRMIGSPSAPISTRDPGGGVVGRSAPIPNPWRRKSAARSRSVRPCIRARSFISRTSSSGKSSVVFI